MPTLARSILGFEAWLATLSLDAAHTDLCPNLAYIPLTQLHRLHAEGCAPTANAVVEHRWHRPALKRARPGRAALIAQLREQLMESNAALQEVAEWREAAIQEVRAQMKEPNAALAEAFT